MKKIILSAIVLISFFSFTVRPAVALINECEAIAGVKTAGTPNFFQSIGLSVSALLASFTSPFGQPDARESDALSNLSPNINFYDRGRRPGAPLRATKPIAGTVTMTGTLKQKTFLESIPVVGSLISLSAQKGAELSGAVFNIAVDSTSGGLAEKEQNTRGTLRDYFGGAGVDSLEQEKVLSWVKAGGVASGDGYLPYKKAGVMDKLLPYQAKGPMGFKKRDDALRDRTLCQIMSGYNLHEKLGNSPTEFDAIDDILIGAVHQVEGTEDATWCTPKPSTEIYRWMYASEIACGNRSFDCGPSLNNKHIGEICAELYGGSILEGRIYEKSAMARNMKLTPAQLALKTPSELAIYDPKNGCGAWFFVPRSFVKEVSGKITEKVEQKKTDPLSQLFERPGTGEAPPIISYPVISAKDISDVFTSPDTQAKKNGQAADINLTQCPNIKGVTGGFPAAIGKGGFSFIPHNLLESFGLTLGVSDNKTSDVLQATTPEPTGGKPIEAKRTYSLTMEVPQEAADLYKDVSGPQGFAMNFIPYEVAKTMQTSVGGVSPGAFPMQAQVNYAENVEGDPKGQIPLLGGVILAADPKDGLISELVMPYNPNKKTSVSRQLRELAKTQEEIASRHPWEQLASFQNPQGENLSQR